MVGLSGISTQLTHSSNQLVDSECQVKCKIVKEKFKIIDSIVVFLCKMCFFLPLTECRRIDTTGGISSLFFFFSSTSGVYILSYSLVLFICVCVVQALRE